MASNDQQIGKMPAQKAKQDLAERLSKALRDNLHRRKAQARSRKLDDFNSDLANQREKDGS